MWSDVEADPAACPGGGSAAQPAPLLPNGFPAGRALCPVCSDFVALDNGAVVPHDTFRGAVDGAEAANRAAWFNTVGWN